MLYIICISDSTQIQMKSLSFVIHHLWRLGAYEWAQKTLKDHAKDKRSYLYTREQLENAKTHDKLWNAAQVHIGLNALKKHNFQ